jgi:hypothetical protein
MYCYCYGRRYNVNVLLLLCLDDGHTGCCQNKMYDKEKTQLYIRDPSAATVDYDQVGRVGITSHSFSSFRVPGRFLHRYREQLGESFVLAISVDVLLLNAICH